MATEVRTITYDEIELWTGAVKAGFYSHVSDGEVELRQRTLNWERCWAAVDGDRFVATIRSFPTGFTVPGGVVEAHALTAVTCRSTHRRQGLMTRMLTPDLANAKERGEVVSVLIAAEWPIYGRFGYGPAVEHCDWSLDASTAQFLDTAPGGKGGTVDPVTPSEVLDIAKPLFDRFRLAVPGNVDRLEYIWPYWLNVETFPGEDKWKGFQVIFRDEAGEPEGYLSYTLDTDKWDGRRPRNVVKTSQHALPTPEVRARAWRFLASLDWVSEVRWIDGSVGDPIRHLLVDGRHVQQLDRNDFVWARVLDVPGALSGRTYACDGTVVLDVIDRHGWASGRYRLDGGRNGATCTPAPDSLPDLTLPVASLGAIYAGGGSLRELADAGLADEHTPGTVDRVDTMFRSPVTPWNITWF